MLSHVVTISVNPCALSSSDHGGPELCSTLGVEFLESFLVREVVGVVVRLGPCLVILAALSLRHQTTAKVLRRSLAPTRTASFSRRWKSARSASLRDSPSLYISSVGVLPLRGWRCS